MDLTGDEAKTYFAKLNAKEGELQDNELEDVSGGRKCGTTYYEGHPLVTALNSCDLFCHEYYWIYGRKAGSGCCKDCFYEDFTGLITICTHPKRYDN